ncbi:multiple monosaccharide ABC transporter permease [Paratissierella segnis]|jgi:putative multiple sugar transport system permease protein|uniref:Xylose transport system permease protein XylH n=1 Tax=Paratissierella segnis TaxID=2763679 RepID=A0A926EWT4_9FIRM|nr:multiple monosaccharide ABC transporter permease [Paratissierella segnis]MBC8588977.1 sugar ABC transporter permease [Paratissierella segnis]
MEKTKYSIKDTLKSNIRKYTMLIALVAIMIFFEILTKGILLKPLNITNLILQNSYILIMAIGMLLVIITGNVDLSVGSVVALIGAVAANLMIKHNMSVVPVIFISLLIGALVGAWHGFWIAFVKIPAFIVTLSGMLLFRGLTLVILKGQTLAPFEKSYQVLSSGFIKDIFNGQNLHITTILVGIVFSIAYIFYEYKDRSNKIKYGFRVTPNRLVIAKIILIIIAINLTTYSLAVYKGIPNVLVLLFFLVLIYSFIANKTVVGRYIYAIGGNEKAARLSGIKTDKVLFWVYVNMGLLTALAGIVFSGRLNAAMPRAGQGFELDAIAACYIGGASASGGIGTIIGAIIGGLVMGVLNNGMSILGIGIDWQQAIKGLVLLIAVAFDAYTKSKVKN